MQSVFQLYESLQATYGAPVLWLVTAIIVLFVIQLCYWMRYYARIPAYRVDRGQERDEQQFAISVIVVVQDDYSYIEETLPLILGQQYPQFEVVVVDLASTEEFSDALLSMQEKWPHLVTSKIEQDPRFPIGRKLALNVGIKAARYERLLITTTAARPTSERWLALMARGFERGDIVLGYCGMECKKGLVNKLIRCARVMTSVRALGSAIRGIPYRGSIHNLGFTKTLYFGAKGFNYLNLNTGEDDLFLQQIATPDNTAIILHPKATVRQWQWGGISWWHNVRKFESYTYKYYPLRIKNAIEWELGSRLLLFLTLLTALCLLPVELKVGAAALWLIRLGIVEFQSWRIRRRLGEEGLGWAWILYDLWAPVCEIRLWLSRTFRPSKGLWR